MIEELDTLKPGEGVSTSLVPSLASKAGEYFTHIRECSECRTHPGGLCAEGEALLDLAAGIPPEA